MENPKNPIKIPEFYCNVCNLITYHKNDYTKHIKTKKHINAVNGNKMETKNPKNKHTCLICLKEYKTKSGLWKHNQICKPNECLEIVKTEQLPLQEPMKLSEFNLHIEMLKQNNEFKELMFTQVNKNQTQTNQLMEKLIEILQATHTSITNNNNINNGQITNNNNYTQFNLQVYLNETCKNAMTIDQFLEYLQPTVEELEDTARLGYVEGITRIIMRGLKDLEEELRPFHCSDLKRETLFIKNSEGEWEKETEEKPTMLNFVKAVGRKNFNNLNEWRKEHPNCKSYDSKSNDMFNKILVNSMSGSTEKEQYESYEKIIKNITKEVVINKSKKNK